MKATFALFSLFSLCAAAAVPVPQEDLFRLGLTPPESIRAHLEELDLDDGQRGGLVGLLDAAQKAMPALEVSVQEHGKALEAVVSSDSPNLEEAEAALDRLLEAEASVKRLQLRTILGVNGILKPEQRTKALEFARRDAENEAAALALAERFKIAFESLGIKPTEALQKGGDQIKQLLDERKFTEALKALEDAAKEVGLDEPAAEVIDFGQFDSGDCDPNLLRERYEAVEERVQQVVRLTTLEQLVQARDELEAAKEAQDAVMVGRILTWAESALP